MSVDIHSPLRNVTCSTLTDNLCESIISLGGSGTDYKNEITTVRAHCTELHASVDTLNIALLRKYDELRRISMEKTEPLSSGRSSSVLKSPKEQLTGVDAVKSDIFKLRLITALFSMISFAVMSSIDVGGHHFEPQNWMFVRLNLLFRLVGN